MRDKISKSGTPVMDFTQPRYNSISNMASVLRVNHTIRFYIILTVQNIPKFKDRANWLHDTFQPMRRHACVYQQTNQNIASVIKTFQNSGRSETESVIVSRLSSIFLRLFMRHTQFFYADSPGAYFWNFTVCSFKKISKLWLTRKWMNIRKSTTV